MSQRHKAYKVTLDRGFASEWNNDHLANFASHIEQYFLDPTMAMVFTWDFSQCIVAPPASWALIGAPPASHAMVVFNTGGATGQTSSGQLMLDGVASNITSFGDAPTFNAVVELVAFDVATRVVEFGLFDTTTLPFTANQDGAYFAVENNILLAVTGDSAAETLTVIGAYSQYANYRISTDGATVNFYVDDMENPAAVHTANLPTTDLTIKFSVVSFNNTDSTIRVDACALERLRAA